MTKHRANIAAFIDSRHEDLIKTAQTLIQAPSPNPPGDVTAAASAAVALIKDAVPSADISTYNTAPSITNVVAVISSGRPGKKLVFSGHLDTYPVGNRKDWTVDPFGAELSSDKRRMYGRGSADMKGGIAASILAAQALAAQPNVWDGDVVVALAGDEETMGKLGSDWLLKNVDAVKSADAMVCGDAGSPLVVRVGEKGLVWMNIEARGRASHGAHVHKGTNAVERLMDALQRLKKLESLDSSKDGGQQVQESLRVIDEARKVSEPLSGEGESDTLKRLTVNIGTISGGVSPNLVPDYAKSEVDVRLPLGITAESFISNVAQILEPLDGVDFTILRKYDPSWTPPSEKIVQYALGASKEVVGEQAVVNMRVGASDSRLFRLRGIPTVVVGLTPFNMGASDEYLDVGELRDVALIHAYTAFDFLKR